MNTLENIAVSPAALRVISVLEDAGYSAWCVGGCVRDALMGRPCHDIDIATNAHWQKTQAICVDAKMQTFETGTKHGTLTVVCEGETFEVTTYRIEDTYTDARHPDSVTFVDEVEQDLARRDFTMNAMAWHPDRGLCDPFGGKEDIAAGIIRAVGNAQQRFSEDALRVLRGVRFSSQLGFCVEDATYKGMVCAADLLKKIAVERICAELNACLCGEHVHDALMRYTNIIGVVIPEILPMENFDQKTPYHIYDVWEHTAYVVQNTPPYLLARWVALFHDMGKPKAFFTDDNGQGHFYGHPKISCTMAKSIMERLKFSTRFSHDVELLVLHHDDVIPATEKAVKRMVRKLEGREDLFRCLCDVKRADAKSQAPHCIERVDLANDLDACLSKILEEEQAFSLESLAISGADLLSEGMAPGPAMGQALNEVLDAVIDEVIPNSRDACLNYIRQRYLDL